MKSLFFLLGIFTVELSAQSSQKAINFDQVHSLVKATEEETIWKDQIDWHTDLWEARQLAGKVGKPIFIWEMDGHPMGCT